MPVERRRGPPIPGSFLDVQADVLDHLQPEKGAASGPGLGRHCSDSAPERSVGYSPHTTTALISPLAYLSAMASSAIGLSLPAWPAVPKASILALQMPLAASIASFRYLRGSNSLLSLFSARRIAPLIARRISVSMLILRTPCLMPSWISSIGTP